MIANYFDPSTERQVERAVRSLADVEELLAVTGRLASERGHPMLVLDREDGSWVGVALTPAGTFLAWTDAEGTSFHSVGEDATGGEAVFDFFGSYTEVPPEHLVPLDRALAALRTYLETGSPAGDDVRFAPD